MTATSAATRRAERVFALAEKLYDLMPPVCWQTESNLALGLGVSRRQIRRAKQHLIETGRVILEERQNGKRANPIHTLKKVNPINPYIETIESGSERENIDWTLFKSFTAKNLNRFNTFEQVEFYTEMGFQTIPLHYPKFRRSGVICSCKRGRNCPSIGKHPAVTWKGLDFAEHRTYRAMKQFWRDDINYNIGFLVDGFAVLDVDYRKGGHVSLAHLQDELGEIPVGLSVATGNGKHIYISETDHQLSNGVGVMGSPGLDIRAKGGIVVAPCSVHHSERQYEWETVGVPEKLPDDWALNLQAVGIGRVHGGAGGDKTNQPEVLLPAKPGPGYVISDGRRNTTLFKFACRERGRGANFAHIYDVISTLNATNCETPLTDSELRTIAAKATRYPSEAEKRERGLPLQS